MTLDHHPIPQEALPPGWGPVDVRDERLVYRQRQPPLELIAERDIPDRAHPSLGIGRCWELQCRHRIGELSITEQIGHVPTKRGAIDGLLDCMHTLTDRLEASYGPIELQSVLDDVSLRDAVPDYSRE